MAISLDDEHFKKREKVGPDEIEEVKKSARASNI